MTPPPWKKRATQSRHATPKSSAFDPSTAIMTSQLPKNSVAETLADKIVPLKVETLPATTRRKCEDLLIDVVGLCVTARNEDYVASALAGWDDDGPCTVIGPDCVKTRRLRLAARCPMSRSYARIASIKPPTPRM